MHQGRLQPEALNATAVALTKPRSGIASVQTYCQSVPNRGLTESVLAAVKPI